MIEMHFDISCSICITIRLHQRGLKTLRDRARLQQVEGRLDELSKEISILRQKLSAKPG
jgi:hypothetical protein